MIKSANDYYYYETTQDEWDYGQWLHVVITWTLGDGITVYLNGCDMDPDGDKRYAYSMQRTDPASRRYTFKVGSGRVFDKNFKGIIDELYIWYESLTPRQIWKLYIQGGTMPWEIGKSTDSWSKCN